MVSVPKGTNITVDAPSLFIATLESFFGPLPSSFENGLVMCSFHSVAIFPFPSRENVNTRTTPCTLIDTSEESNPLFVELNPQFITLDDRFLKTGGVAILPMLIPCYKTEAEGGTPICKTPICKRIVWDSESEDFGLHYSRALLPSPPLFDATAPFISPAGIPVVCKRKRG
ncbi:hypothetical protein BD779DRAFT_966979 [Infundibulicybe gibba]|nr:hypothetical protein BD779DRAFT_966979 [Infundibulicybe gibba]